MYDADANGLESILHPLSSLGLVRRDYETKEQMKDRYIDNRELEEKWKFYGEGGIYSAPLTKNKEVKDEA